MIDPMRANRYRDIGQSLSISLSLSLSAMRVARVIDKGITRGGQGYKSFRRSGDEGDPSWSPLNTCCNVRSLVPEF